MTTETLNCPNGHQNPSHQHFCGECGAPLPVVCPNGHLNPASQNFCGECGAALDGVQRSKQKPEAKAISIGTGQAGGQEHTQRRTLGAHQSPPPPDVAAANAEQAGHDAQLNTGIETTASTQHHSDEDAASAEQALKVGDCVQIQTGQHSDRFNGMVGIVQEIPNGGQGSDIHVALKGHKLKFKPNELQLVGKVAQQPTRSRGVTSSSGRVTLLVAGILLIVVVVGSALSGGGNRSTQKSSGRHTPSYDYGYNLIINESHEIVAEVNGQLRSEGKQPTDSPAKLLGANGEYIASTCEGYVEAIVAGSVLRSRPPLPQDFSSADFLKGCNDGGKSLLASG
ncbi:zinc ribbon domain-containing protein [Mycobacterium sp. Z3061]|uniref:zinc ribbon domain-containing protein n=1 Tax=Mycobacterium sp. Z3061 TaxID=3073562 RepID=UPI00287398DB|nr:zinc ribbon domain-containing protein [Mycobacterium sp. Z3061]